MKRDFQSILYWLILLILSLIWGSSFILMKYGLRSFSYGQVAGFRMFIAFITLLPFAIKNLGLIKRSNIIPLLTVAFVGNCIPAFLFTMAETRIDSSLAGMLNALTPFFTLMVGALFYHTKLKGGRVVGIFLGLLGSVLLILDNANGVNFNAWSLLVVLATLMYGVNINNVKAKLSDLTGLQITSLAFFMVGPVVILYLLTTNLPETFAQPNAWTDFFYVFLLGFLASAFAVVLINYLILRTSAIFASSVTYLIPIVAVGWGLIDGEVIFLRHYIGMTLVLFGVYLVNKKLKK